MVTLQAIRLCHDVGVGLVQLDTDGELLASTCRRETGSVRVRRVQALAPYTEIGVEIARAVMHAKVSGQAALLGRLPGGEHARGALDYARHNIATATTLEEIQQAESHAAFAYWERWATVPVRFERAAEGRLPDHWATLGQRTSPVF
jgi:CRISPR-associated endonuclease Cas1